MERLRRNLTQEELADVLGASVRSVRRWEAGRALPHAHHRARYCELLGTTADDLFAGVAVVAGARSPVDTLPWNVPLPRNPFFAAREDVLAMLQADMGAAAPRALCGITGVGKTQVAVEYAYRSAASRRGVLWLRAETPEAVGEDARALAVQLGLCECLQGDVEAIVAAVQLWLRTHDGWLLILDNVTNLPAVAGWLAASGWGEVLLTCQGQATGALAGAVFIEPMSQEDAVTFLLRRAKLVSCAGSSERVPRETLRGVREIADAMGGLPLALDQAGAYLEETGCTPADYLERYHRERISMLQRRGGGAIHHPQSVAATLRVSIDQVRRRSVSAAELLVLCAFLRPNAIPEPIVLAGMRMLGQSRGPDGPGQDEFDEAVAVLRAYSLVQRDGDRRTLSVHRLVEAVLRDDLSAEERREWASHAVRAVAAAYPDVDDLVTWDVCSRWFPHAHEAARLAVELDLRLPEATRVLRLVGSHLRALGRSVEAAAQLRAALEIGIEVLGTGHPDVGGCLDGLAVIYHKQHRLAEADELFRRALEIRQRALGHDHPDVATSMNNLGMLRLDEGRLDEAEVLFRLALRIRRRRLGPLHPVLAISVNNLAGYCYLTGRYEEAEALFRQALVIRERALGPEHPHVATVLNNLGCVNYDRGRHEPAECFHRRALAIREKALGPDSYDAALSKHNLAMVCHAGGRLVEADELYRDSLRTWRRDLTPGHPRVAQALTNMARLRDDQRRHARAGDLYRRAVAIQVRAVGSEHPDLAYTLHHLGCHHELLGRHGEASQAFRRALDIRRRLLGPDHPDSRATEAALARAQRGAGS